MIRHTRRSLLTAAGAVVAATAAGTAGAAGIADVTPWRLAPRIVARARPARMPHRDFPVTDYGAVGDATTMCTGAFAAAVEACADAGGGRVVVPAGVFLTGPIHLRSNVELHVTADATVRFSRDRSDYLPVVYSRYEGIELYNRSPMIYAYRQHDVAVTGRGLIDGRADEEHWWNLTGDGGEAPDKDLLNQMAEDGVPVEERVFGEGHSLRVNMVQFYECTNVRIQGVTVMNSPMWHLHPVLCENVLIQDVTIDTPGGSNTDGIDPESCRYVVIRRCTISTGDDCVAFKAGKNADGRRVNAPCEYAVVTGCDMADGNGGVTVGSETTGSVRYIFASDCRMSSPNLGRPIRIKTNPVRGGEVRHLYFRDITVGQAADSGVEIALDYENITEGDFYPDVRQIDIRDYTVQSAPRAFYLIGNDANPIRDVRLTDCDFVDMAEDDIIRNVENLQLIDVTRNGVPY